ncbi:zinc finger protein 32-like [Centropristis striata]|uniref:zinc finger protein 32-like n=1 Tax=Centropristis striata TaxID=184440 RepID=UPI0027E197D2|nr:zinc finger protein 32-like [Centropristis striata]
MSKGEMLRVLVKQRITAAAEEIFGLFERTITEYEEELSRSKEENKRQQKLLDAVYNPQLRLHRADSQQLLVDNEEMTSEQQDWSSSLDQEDPEPPQIKEEQEELWISQEGEQLAGLEEADLTNEQITLVTVKSDSEEESSQLLQKQIEQMKTEADEEDCGGLEPARNSDSDSHLQPKTEERSGDSSEVETDDSGDWNETRETQSSLKSLTNGDIPVSDSGCSTGANQLRCSDCGKIYKTKKTLMIHKRTHTGEKPFICSVCGKRFLLKHYLKYHMMNHTGEKPFTCSVCSKRFATHAYLRIHMRTHTGEKPFQCSVCKRRFSHSGAVQIHMTTHTGEKSFLCSFCGKRFSSRSHLVLHTRYHTGEKPYSCSVCNKRFVQSAHMKRHMMTHTGEKPFDCSVCSEKFRYKEQLAQHMTHHRGKKVEQKNPQ